MSDLQQQSFVGIFDRESEDQVRSPEKLNEYIRVATPGRWLFVAALALVLAAFVIWGLIGAVPKHIETTGIGLREGFNREEVESKEKITPDDYRVENVLCLVDSSQAMSRDLMHKPASVVFRDGKRVSGEASLVDTAILQDSEIHKILESYQIDTDWVFSKLGEGSYRYLLYVALDETLDYLYWGESADVSIVIDEEHPIDLVMN